MPRGFASKTKAGARKSGAAAKKRKTGTGSKAVRYNVKPGKRASDNPATKRTGPQAARARASRMAAAKKKQAQAVQKKRARDKRGR